MKFGVRAWASVFCCPYIRPTLERIIYTINFQPIAQLRQDAYNAVVYGAKKSRFLLNHSIRGYYG